MKKKLSWGELLSVSVMLFGMFFGAGNLIFPVHMGQLAGHNVWWALLGFVVTGVGLPLLSVAALGISRSEVASTIFINACNEFQFMESVGPRREIRAKAKKSAMEDDVQDEESLCKLIESILSESEEDEMYASELKGVLLRLRPQFNEKTYGCATFGKLLAKLSTHFGTIRIRNDSYNVMVSLVPDAAAPGAQESQPLRRDTWQAAFAAQLQRYKDDGFERINPSILKADIISSYPDFTEKSIGFRRFSDIPVKKKRSQTHHHTALAEGFCHACGVGHE